MRVEGLALDLEIEAVVAGAQALVLALTAVETPQRLARVREIGRLERADRLDDLELGQLVEPVELVHALLRKRDLIHGKVERRAVR